MRASKNFTWAELRCRCGCGRRNISPRAIKKLQKLRDALGPLKINSAARCPRHNARVGGSPRSQHRSTEFIPSTAFDISLHGLHGKEDIIRAAEEVGFKGIGINYNTFVHVDDRNKKARW